MTELDKLVAYIRETLVASGELTVEEEAPYSSLPFCVIDAVYSIGARYESTDRTVCDFRAWANWKDQREHSIAEFLNLLNPYSDRWENLATEVFRNRQRTSSRSGILKAQAVYLFAQTLNRFGIDTLADVEKLDPDAGLSAGIAAIPGQASGISFKYFLMLAGHADLVKPDRMLTRFVADALDVPSTEPDTAESMVKSACQVLKEQLPKLEPSRLDYAIWSYQRTRNSN